MIGDFVMRWRWLFGVALIACLIGFQLPGFQDDPVVERIHNSGWTCTATHQELRTYTRPEVQTENVCDNWVRKGRA